MIASFLDIEKDFKSILKKFF